MDMTREYQNGAFIPGSDALPALWATKAAAFRDSLGDRARLDLSYGPAPRNHFDLFLPESTPKGLMIFIHGGYWLETDKSLWSHLAAGAIARGWACVMPGYTLAPEARISQITTEVDAAITAACALVEGPVVVTGHSAGGHLAARMGNPDRNPILQARLNRVVPISPLAELEPLAQTDMQPNLRLDAAEIAAESPTRHALRTDAHIWVGGAERPAFLWQARTLSENWNCPWTVDPGTHHFNVIDALEDPTSPLIKTCLSGL
ncbi:MAG: alpha/beta hydrolase [Cypionkella sp.]|uniref:alpha/beta hydrolase n=1 Tax=Cypionkella sp. TaxID=2811411 RepID=UPI002ABC3E5B|nr:alpha/beta hydrolase [Cypionkella sp.]MDZ4310787.1 alpha/beta hydrolase [Cypionkella sp.]